ncbi:MAG TPA: hypothetical protein DDY82_03370 [Clostridiales bacterium]|nr:hypothetical protein [Clostridiales bacterium]
MSEKEENLNEVELTNSNGETAVFSHIITVEYDGGYYSAFEPKDQVDGIENGEFVVFKLHPETDEMEFIDDEDLLDKVCEVIYDALDEEGE